MRTPKRNRRDQKNNPCRQPRHQTATTFVNKIPYDHRKTHLDHVHRCPRPHPVTHLEKPPCHRGVHKPMKGRQHLSPLLMKRNPKPNLFVIRHWLPKNIERHVDERHVNAKDVHCRHPPGTSQKITTDRLNKLHRLFSFLSNICYYRVNV